MAERHVLGISGGKDSAALAVYMSLHHPELPIEYFFTDSRPGALAPCARRARGPRVRTLSTCSWLHLLKGWSLVKTELTPRSWTNFKGFHEAVSNRVQARSRQEFFGR